MAERFKAPPSIPFQWSVGQRKSRKTEPVEADPGVPFRWDMAAQPVLGSTVPEYAPARDVVPSLIECAGKVLARSGNGDLVFVGRSLDSLHDMLKAALTSVTAEQSVQRLPLSFSRERNQETWARRALTLKEKNHARGILTDLGVTPQSLAQRKRPVVFVDVVSSGGTFSDLFHLLFEWTQEEKVPWRIIRQKVRFVGVTPQKATSPNTFRWQQHAKWVQSLPASSIVNVSLRGDVWSYLADHQYKLTRSYNPNLWPRPADGPQRTDKAKEALTEAAAFVAYAQSKEGCQALATAIRGEPALSEAWLRTLARKLRR